ncbi:MAG: efflux RND transporter periplasmic adaptor subunit [Syntrophales bacterium]|jgi:HlyD family secretion protein
MKKKAIIAGIAVLLLAGGAYFAFHKTDGNPVYKTENVTRGDIRASVTATGTVNAVTTVQVGTQVSGTIKNIYVDYNSPVKDGQLLALIDPETFESQVYQARANLLLAKANLEKALAAVVDAKRTMDRNKVLLANHFIAQSDLDTSETNYQTDVAQVSASKAQVEQAKAALTSSEINLKYTRILSPVSGTVISRNVDVGQTVAASFQTPTLFSIAQDLAKMQIDTNVDEADIGKVKVGQPVEFTVDAYPDIIFNGKVSQVRNAPITVQNVVTYDVVILVDNSDFKLKPGMTANVSVITSIKKGVLRILNAALRFKPADLQTKAPSEKGSSVWVPGTNMEPRRVKIVTGISDGNYTEIVSGNLREGSEVIIASSETDKKAAASAPSGPRFIR